MAGKKKRKQVVNPARGFATVSIPSKPKETTATSDEQDDFAERERMTIHSSSLTYNVAAIDPNKLNVSSGDSEDTLKMTPNEFAHYLEQAELQHLLDEHAAKVKDDASRQVTKIITERRQMREQAERATVVGLTEQFLDSVSEQESFSTIAELVQASPGIKFTEVENSEFLIKIWTLHEVLLRLHMPSVEDVLSHVLLFWKQTGHCISSDYLSGLAEALLWYACKFPSNELPNYETGRIGDEGRVNDTFLADPSIESNKLISESLSEAGAEPNSQLTDQKILAQHVETSEDEEEDEDENDPDHLVDRWLNIQTRNFNLQQDENMDREIFAKKQRRIMHRLRKIEQDVLFDETLAHVRWQPLLKDLQIEAGRTKKATKHLRTARDVREKPESDDSDSGEILMEMFANNDIGDSSDTANEETLLQIHDFGAWSGVNPRRVFEEATIDILKHGSLRYKTLAKTGYSSRLQLEWTTRAILNVDYLSTKSIPDGVVLQNNTYSWCIMMESFATKTIIQSEAYLATLALFLLAFSSSVASKHWQRLPKVWKDVYIQCQERRAGILRAEDLNTLQQLYKMVDSCVASKPVSLSGDTTGQGKPKQFGLPSRGRFHVFSADETIQRWSRIASRKSFGDMQATRRNLPVFSYKSQIINVFENHQVTIICADTGAGKSTQIPAYILEHRLSSGQDYNVIVTQPRRISAISLARRVSTELGEDKDALGTFRSVVGYAIRLETKTSPETRLTFATTGVLLRMLQGSRDLEDFNCLVIDEVHERTMDVDLLLIAIKQLRLRRTDLKIILMSATVNATKFSSYFDGAPVLDIPGRTFPVDVRFLEDAIEETLDTSTINGDVGRMDQSPLESTDSDDMESSHDLVMGLENYSSATRHILEQYNYRAIDYELIVNLASIIVTKPKFQVYDGAILIFMPGIVEIRRLHNMLLTTKIFSSKWMIYMLHSSFSTQELEQAFLIPPPGYRKVVIATNIAETGITIPDVTTVIDTCREKVMRFDERRQLSRLTEGLIARASAQQRRGRAARVKEGLCFHLVSKHRFETKMLEQAVPEMLRLSLQDPILRVKVWDLGPIEDVLTSAIDPPSLKNIRRATSKLQDTGAIDNVERLTSLGIILAKLPLEVALGKMAVFGVIFQCLDPIVTIIASFSVKSIFLERSVQEKGGSNVFANGDSDFLMTYNAYSGWKKARRAGTGQQFCQKYHLSQFQLQQMEEQKTQLYVYLADAHLVVLGPSESAELHRARNSRSTGFNVPTRFGTLSSDKMIGAMLALALYPKMLKREGEGYRNVYTNQQLQLAPTSINKIAVKPPIWLCYLEATRAKSGRLNAFHSSRVTHAALGLLVGEADFKLFSGIVDIDNGRIRLSFRNWKEVFALQRLRSQLAKVISKFLMEPGVLPQSADQRWLDLVAVAIDAKLPQ